MKTSPSTHQNRLVRIPWSALVALLFCSSAIVAGGNVSLTSSKVAAVPAAVAFDKNDKLAEELIESYFAADGRQAAGRAEQLRLLGEIDLLVPELSSKDVKSWRKKILELWSEGRALEKDSGRQRYWEEEKRGLFIVGGQTRNPKGLLIGMHGGGVGSGDCGEAHGFLNSAAKKRKWLAIFPEVLEKTEHGWTTSGTEEWVIDLIDAARRTWDIDPNQVFFAGHSMGGYGSWTLGAHHADRVAALAPAAGAPTPIMGSDDKFIDIIEGVIPNLRNVPMLIYQSDDDPQVPPEANRVAVKKLGEAKERWGGYPFEYWEEENKGHSYPPGGGKGLLERIAKNKRNPYPERVVWQPVLDWKRQFYWLHWEQPKARATVVADLDRKANKISITCEWPLTGGSVVLDDRVLKTAKPIVVEVNGKEVFNGVPQAKLSTLVMTGARGDSDLLFSMRIPLVP